MSKGMSSDEMLSCSVSFASSRSDDDRAAWADRWGGTLLETLQAVNATKVRLDRSLGTLTQSAIATVKLLTELADLAKLDQPIAPELLLATCKRYGGEIIGKQVAAQALLEHDNVNAAQAMALDSFAEMQVEAAKAKGKSISKAEAHRLVKQRAGIGNGAIPFRRPGKPGKRRK